MKFTIREKVENKRVRRLINELPSRVAAIIEHFPHDISEMVLAELLARAPEGIEGYPKMLEIRRFELQGMTSVFGIVAPGSAHSHKLAMDDAADTVLYIRPKRIANGLLDPGATILSESNPWTMETLPYEPTKREATVISRKVTTREVGIISERRMAERDSVVQRLEDAGVEVVRVHPTLLARRVGRDITFEVLRREFGIGGSHDAHWRPAVRKARGEFVQRLLKKKYIRWLAVPSEMRWRERITVDREKASAVKRYQAFQDKVASGK